MLLSFFDEQQLRELYTKAGFQNVSIDICTQRMMAVKEMHGGMLLRKNNDVENYHKVNE